MKYRIHDVKNFVEASNCESLHEASKKLEISEPALTESLKKLEGDLGALVFYRSRDAIQLTPSGKNFLFKAQRALQSLTDLDLSESTDNLFEGRSISLGCQASVAQFSLPKAFAYLKDKAPDYQIQLKLQTSKNIQTEIQDGRLDLGIVINPVEASNLVIKPLAQDLFGVWAHKSISESDTLFADLELEQTQNILKNWKMKPSKVHHTDNQELISRLVNQKLGFGILSGRTVEISGLPLRMIPSLPTSKDQIALIHRHEFGNATTEKLMIEAIKKAFLA